MSTLNHVYTQSQHPHVKLPADLFIYHALLIRGSTCLHVKCDFLVVQTPLLKPPMAHMGDSRQAYWVKVQRFNH